MESDNFNRANADSLGAVWTPTPPITWDLCFVRLYTDKDRWYWRWPWRWLQRLPLVRRLIPRREIVFTNATPVVDGDEYCQSAIDGSFVITWSTSGAASVVKGEFVENDEPEA